MPRGAKIGAYKERTTEFGQRVTEARCRLGMSQVRLAEELGYTHYTIRQWERGRAKPLPRSLNDLRQILGDV